MLLVGAAAVSPLFGFLLAWPNPLGFPRGCFSALRPTQVTRHLWGQQRAANDITLEAAAPQVNESLEHFSLPHAGEAPPSWAKQLQVQNLEGRPLAVATEASPERLLRIRRRNIRFLCRSRRNRARGLLKPAAAALAEAAEKHSETPEARYALECLQLKDPLVAEVPTKRWRTQWFPSFARRSLVPLTRAARRCDILVEVRDARLPLLSRSNLRLLQRPIPKAVVLTHADQACPKATRLWQRYFRRESREAAALQLHAELTRARRQLGSAGLLRAAAAACPLAPRLPYLFVDLREPAGVIRVQRLLRNLVKRHRRYQEELQHFRGKCKRMAAAAAAAAARSATPESAVLGEAVAALENTTASTCSAEKPEEKDASRALLRQRKPLRVLIVGAPNVGKSKLANCLLGRKAARSYSWPGVTRTVNVHRHPPLLTGEGDRSRLFEVIDTPGFIPVSPSERVRKKRLSAQQQQQLQERIGTASRVRQLPLELFFDLNYPRLSADELALLAAFRMLPESCLFTIEEAAVALGEAFFRVGEQLPAATDVKRLLTRYQLHSLALDKSSNMGLQLVLKLAEQRHHSNSGAAAQRLLSDLHLGYLGRNTFELPPKPSRPPDSAVSTSMQSEADASGRGNNLSSFLKRLREGMRPPPEDGTVIEELTEGRAASLCGGMQDRNGGQGMRKWKWTMLRDKQRLSFVLDTTHLPEEGSARDAGGQARAVGSHSASSETKEVHSPHTLRERQETPDLPGGGQRNAQQPGLAVSGWLEGW